MTKFIVEVPATVTYTVEVEANNDYEAMGKAQTIIEDRNSDDEQIEIDVKEIYVVGEARSSVIEDSPTT